MARGVPVSLVRYPARDSALVAHSHHPKSTIGGSGVFEDGGSVLNKSVNAPKAFLHLMPMVRKVHHRWAPSVQSGFLNGKSGLLGGKPKPGGPTQPLSLGTMPPLGTMPLSAWQLEFENGDVVVLDSGDVPPNSWPLVPTLKIG